MRLFPAVFSRLTRPQTALLLLILVAGLCLRIWNIDNRGFWQDEVELQHYGLTGVGGEALAPLGGYVYGAAMGALRSTDPWAVRLPSVIFGAISILVTFLVVAASGSRRVAMLAAAFVAICPLAVYSSQQARPYALFQVFTLLACHFMIRVTDVDRSLTSWVGLFASLFLAAQTHLLTSHVAAAFGIFCLWKLLGPLSRRQALFALFVIGAASALGAAWVLERPISLIAETTIHDSYPEGPLAFARIAVLSLGTGFHLEGGKPRALDAIGYLFGSLAVWGIFARQGVNKNLRVLLTLLIAVNVIVIYQTLGNKFQWMWWQRYMTPALAPALVLASSGLYDLATRVPHAFRHVLIAAAFCLFIPGIHACLTRPPETYQTRPGKQAARVFSIRNSLDGVVVLSQTSWIVFPRGAYIWMDERLDDLPVRTLARGKVYRVDLEPARYGLMAPRVRDMGRVPLSPGNYAFFNYGGNETFSCTDVPGMTLRRNTAIENAELSTALVKVCRVR